MRILMKDAGYNYQPGDMSHPSAVSKLNLTIENNEFTALIGHSGSGKSTLAMLLAGLYLPTQGQVLMDGKPAVKNSVFPGAGVVFQYPEQQLFGETVYEEVAFGPKNFGLSGRKLEEAIKNALIAVNLNPELFLPRSPFTLSGGEKRRVALACVLAAGAKLLIFDEPSAGLDEKGRQWIIDLAKKEHKKGKTIIWISHNMDEVAQLAKRILVLDKGQLAADGSPLEVFAKEEYLKSLGLSIPQAASLLRRLKKRGLNIPALGLNEDEAYLEIMSLKGGEGRA